MPTPFARAFVAAALGLVLGTCVFVFLQRRPRLAGADFGYVWRAAGHLTESRNPYDAMPPGPRYGVDGPFLYPLPAAVLAIPLARLNAAQASAVFFGVSTALLAFGMTALGWWRLAAVVSPPYLLALLSANWSPLMLAAATIPWLGWLMVAKPNLGLIVFAAWPRWATVVGALALIAVSVLVLPSWPLDWLAHVRAETIPHEPLARWALGAIGLAGLLRWRTPEGRLLAAFTLVPVSAFPYDFLLLWLIPRTRRQMTALTACAWLAAPVIVGIDARANAATVSIVRAVLVLGLVVPATIIVLRFPNRVAHAAPDPQAPAT
jgi:hypothetical protein